MEDLENLKILHDLQQTLQSRKNADPTQSYTAKLFHKGNDALLKKFAEESAEFALAAKDFQFASNSQNQQHLIYEAADVMYHFLATLTFHNLDFADVCKELKRREGTSGIAEKNSRKEK